MTDKKTRARRDNQCQCVGDKNCPMTAGYYIGGGQYICWLHALTVKGMMQAIRESGQEITALPGDSE